MIYTHNICVTRLEEDQYTFHTFTWSTIHHPLIACATLLHHANRSIVGSLSPSNEMDTGRVQLVPTDMGGLTFGVNGWWHLAPAHSDAGSCFLGGAHSTLSRETRVSKLAGLSQPCAPGTNTVRHFYPTICSFLQGALTESLSEVSWPM